jgi:hypothetical protein
LILPGLWLIYLSFVTSGSSFFSWECDGLLLEVGLIAQLLAPPRLSPGPEPPPPRYAVVLAHLLLFRFMVSSALVKISSPQGDWLNLSALHWHLQSQPMPSVFAVWGREALPAWVWQATVAATLLIELIVPFAIWAPKRVRRAAFLPLVLLQVGIAATGNYAWFNLLTIVLTLLVLDDGVWRRIWPARMRPDSEALPPVHQLRPVRWLPRAGIFAVILALSLLQTVAAITGFRNLPESIQHLGAAIAPLNIVNVYVPFGNVNHIRSEIILQGSRDGKIWLDYEFPWKPGNVRRVPGLAMPHQPRLDWAIWMVTSRRDTHSVWLHALQQAQLEGRPEVLALLAHNPFGNKPPKYVRALIFRYELATAAQRQASGQWWLRSDMRVFLPARSLH